MLFRSEFVNDIENVFPDDVDILTAKNALIAIRKANPKMIVKIWKTFIVDKYKSEIEQGDITFFLHKDYSTDISDSQYSNKIMESINRLREPISRMTETNKIKIIKYVQNLTKLSEVISSNET